MKPLLIDDNLHRLIKIHCVKKGIKIKDYISDLLNKALGLKK